MKNIYKFLILAGCAGILAVSCSKETLDTAPAGSLSSEEIFSEEHQAKVYEHQIKYSDGRIQGLFPWILYDFRSPVRMNPYQQGYNRKGVIADDKISKKMAFYVLQDYYRNKK